MADPKIVGERVGFKSKIPIGMIIEGTRTNKKLPAYFDYCPTQSDYIKLHSKEDLYKEKNERKFLLKKTILNLLPEKILNIYRQYKNHKKFSLTNRKFFKPLFWE